MILGKRHKLVVMRQLVLIANNLRSSHNVGSLLRTADGLGVEKVYLTGYTPYPLSDQDKRLPHLSKKIDSAISKIALGAEKYIDWEHQEEITHVITQLKAEGYKILALEQTKDSVALNKYQPEEKIAILVGREVEGIEPEVLELCDSALEIPMLGRKESFNVVQAAAMALYYCRFMV